jgi:hypothetical protein
MLFQLLIDFDLVDFAKQLPASQRQRLYAHFRKIQEYLGHYSDLIESDPEGRRLDVSFFEDMIICYWTDTADRHVKILRISKRQGARR